MHLSYRGIGKPATNVERPFSAASKCLPGSYYPNQRDLLSDLMIDMSSMDGRQPLALTSQPTSYQESRRASAATTGVFAGFYLL